MNARRLPIALLALAALLSLSACGSSGERDTTGSYAGVGGVGAPYLNVGPLIYQVQISRQLNPFDVEDSAYLEGLAPAERRLAPGQEWFGVFMQVYNHHPHDFPAAHNVLVYDTQGNVYTPITPGPSNLYAYRAGLVPARSMLPIPSSSASDGPTQGALLLYKVQLASLENRPLTIRIANPTKPAETASAELDT